MSDGVWPLLVAVWVVLRSLKCVGYLIYAFIYRACIETRGAMVRFSVGALADVLLVFGVAGLGYVTGFHEVGIAFVVTLWLVVDHAGSFVLRARDSVKEVRVLSIVPLSIPVAVLTTNVFIVGGVTVVPSLLVAVLVFRALQLVVLGVIGRGLAVLCRAPAQ